MKTTNKFLALAFMAVAMVFASCSKDNDDNPVVAFIAKRRKNIFSKTWLRAQYETNK